MQTTAVVATIIVTKDHQTCSSIIERIHQSTEDFATATIVAIRI